MLDLANQFLAFCRSKPADEAYEYMNVCDCACGQFGHFMGLLAEGKALITSAPIWEIHGRFIAEVRDRPHTFGALTDRLEAALKARFVMAPASPLPFVEAAPDRWSGALRTLIWVGGASALWALCLGVM